MESSAKGTRWAMMHSQQAQAQHVDIRLAAAEELRANETLQGLIYPEHVTQFLSAAHQNRAPYREALGSRPASALPDAMADKLEKAADQGSEQLLSHKPTCIMFDCATLCMLQLFAMSSSMH